MYRIIYIFWGLCLALACGQNHSDSSSASALVTVSQFQSFLQKNELKTSADTIGWVGIYDNKYNRWRRILGANYLKPDGRSDALSDEPVTNISWHEADAYCRSHSLRLPTLEDLKKSNPIVTHSLYGEWTATPHAGGENAIHFESAMLINGISLPGYYIYTHDDKVGDVTINNKSLPAESRYGISKISCRCVK